LADHAPGLRRRFLRNYGKPLRKNLRHRCENEDKIITAILVPRVEIPLLYKNAILPVRREKNGEPDQLHRYRSRRK
jgi:hypothetical protein